MCTRVCGYTSFNWNNPWLTLANISIWKKEPVLNPTGVHYPTINGLKHMLNRGELHFRKLTEILRKKMNWGTEICMLSLAWLFQTFQTAVN